MCPSTNAFGARTFAVSGGCPSSHSRGPPAAGAEASTADPLLFHLSGERELELGGREKPYPTPPSSNRTASFSTRASVIRRITAATCSSVSRAKEHAPDRLADGADIGEDNLARARRRSSCPLTAELEEAP